MNRMNSKKAVFAIVVGICLVAVGCGGVAGHTYQSEGGVVKIEFGSNGKANLSMGPMQHTCDFVEESKSVAVTCDGDKTVFTVDGDGNLVPPATSFIGKLTKVK
jgi:hypothetical protein